MKITILNLVLAFACAFTPAVMAGESLKAGEALPKLAPLLPGEKLPATAGKVVLVDFWASWCGPCKASFPCLNRLQKDYGGKGLVMIAVGVDEKAGDFEKFKTTMGATFPVVHDTAHKVAAVFNPPTMPTSYLIDSKGVIRHVHSGFDGKNTEKQYIAEIEALLAK